MSSTTSNEQTSSSSNVNYGSTYVSGFYHDIQKSNRLLSVTLHPSTLPPEDKNSNNTTDNSGGNSTSSGNNNSSKGSTSKDWIDVDDPDGYTISGDCKVKYRRKPIATAILKEDFTIAVANNWTDFNGGDTINQFWSSVRPFAAYASYAGDRLSEMSEIGNELGNLGSMAVEWINRGIDAILPYVKKGTDYLNRALVTQGSRFSYYSGTGTSFGNLTMKYTIFADWKPSNTQGSDENSTYEYISVQEQLDEITPYLMGKFVPWDEDDPSKALNQFIGWQKPPGGFKAEVKNIDTFVRGTLMLNFGGYYCVPNIVIRDAQMTFSKQMVKDPKNPNKISPLSCDVQLTLQPATKFSDVMLFDFCNGTFTNTDVEEIQTILTNRITDIKAKNKELFGGPIDASFGMDNPTETGSNPNNMANFDRPNYA